MTPATWPATLIRERLQGSDLSAVADVPGPSRSGDVPPSGELARRRGGRRGSPSAPRAALTALAGGRRMIGVADALIHHDDWNIGVLASPIRSTLTQGVGGSIHWLPTNPGHYAADPFGIERDGMLHILYEDFDQRRSIGTIRHVSVGPGGDVSESMAVLEPGMHASYPFLIEDEGRIFMLPEIAASGELTLYEARDFPGQWHPVATLLAGIPAVDASVLQFQDRWWMFACRSDYGINHDLFIWHAPDLRGPWTPHSDNPVKTDARSARPGGTPFVVDGILYRPSQDDSTIYGRRVVINRVDMLTPTSFRERPARVVSPVPDSPYPAGLHTLSAVGDRTLIDGNRRHFVLDALRAKLGR